MKYIKITYKMKLPELYKKYKDKECVILSCGPSLKEYSKDKITNFCKNKIVICIKEAVLEYEDICDYFIFNRWRVRNYNIKNKKITVICQTTPNHPNCPGKNKVDLIIPHDRDFKNKCLLKNHNFELNNFEKKISRTWGPGILLETVFYITLYMGIKKCYTIGWDLTDKDKIGTIEHYFDKNNDKKYSESMRTLNMDYKKEMKLYHENIYFAYEYFKKKNMDIIVCGEKSFIDNRIPRHYL
jgi:hypothetical protein